MKTLAIVLAATGVLFAGSLFAQSQENVTLRIRNGSVMTSSGGEFVTAQSGQGLTRGEKLSISNATYAQAVYDRGTQDTRDDCVIEFKTAGVYEVPGDCKPAGAWQAGSNGINKWIVAGVAIGAAAMLNDSPNDSISYSSVP